MLETALALGGLVFHFRLPAFQNHLLARDLVYTHARTEVLFTVGSHRSS